MRRDCASDEIPLPVARQTSQAQENNAAARAALAEHEFSEILICRKEYRLFTMREVENRIVGQSRLHFSDVPHLVPITSEPLDDLAIQALIGKEIHAASPGAG
jgi:hypothetical protein